MNGPSYLYQSAILRRSTVKRAEYPPHLHVKVRMKSGVVFYTFLIVFPNNNKTFELARLLKRSGLGTFHNETIW